MRYWIWWNDIIQGPFELDELTALRAFSEDLLVCMEDREDWIPAGRVADLSSAIEQARERRVGPITPPPPPPPKRPPIVTPLQGEFFGEPPGQQSLLESEDEPKGPYAYRPITEEVAPPSSYLLGQATMPFHFMRQPRTSSSVIEMPRPQPARVVQPPHITYIPPPVIKESPVRKPVEEPAFEEKIEEKPVIPLELFRERPASLAPMLGEPPAAERKLEWLPWIMGVVLAIGVLSSMGYWLLDRASSHSAIAEANRLEPPKILSQKYPPHSVGEGKGGGQVRQQTPPSPPSPIEGEGVLAKVFSTLFGRSENPSSSVPSVTSEKSYDSRGRSSNASSQSSQSSLAGSHSVWANALSAILSKVGLAASPATSGMADGFSSVSSPAATGRGSMGSPPATAGNDNERASETSDAPGSSQLSQSSSAHGVGQGSGTNGSNSIWANAISAILSKVGLAPTSAPNGMAAGQVGGSGISGSAASSTFQAGSNESSNSSGASAASQTAYGSHGGSSNASSQLPQSIPTHGMAGSQTAAGGVPGSAASSGLPAGSDGRPNSWVDSTQLQRSSNMSQSAQASKAQASSQPTANSSSWVKTVASILAKVGLVHVQSEMAAGQVAGEAASPAVGQAASAVSGAATSAASAALHVGSALIPTSSVGSHTASARPKSLSVRSAHKGGKAAVKKKVDAHHASKAKSHAQKALSKNAATHPADEAEMAAANALPGVGAVTPGAAVMPEVVPAVDAPVSTPVRPPDPWKGKQNEAISLVMSKTLPKSKITIGNQARALLQQMHEKELLHAAETGERLYLPDKLTWTALQEQGSHYRVYLNFLAWQINGERVQTRSYQFVTDLERKEVHADDAATQQDLLTQPAELTFKHNPMATDIDSILGGVDTYNKHKVQMIIVKKNSRNREDRKKIETALGAAADKVRRAIVYFRRTYAEKSLQNVAKAYDFMELLKG